ncbi:hypothetical protein BH11PLA1_BH11PLA1_19260 [soil metagenome]
MPSEPCDNVILNAMLDRLYAAIMGGPSMNCRPASSRQRVDFAALARLGSTAPAQALSDLLSATAETSVLASIPRTRASERAHDEPDAFDGSSAVPPLEAATTFSRGAEKNRPRAPFDVQQALITKLRHLADDALTYEQDTGAHVLYVGYPLLSIPGAAAGKAQGLGGGAFGGGRQILAPVAYIPVTLTVHGGGKPRIELACRADEVDRVIPNDALRAWLQRQGMPNRAPAFTDESGQDPWREIRALCAEVTGALDLPTPDFVSALRGDDDGHIPPPRPRFPAPRPRSRTQLANVRENAAQNLNLRERAGIRAANHPADSKHGAVHFRKVADHRVESADLHASVAGLCALAGDLRALVGVLHASIADLLTVIGVRLTVLGKLRAVIDVLLTVIGILLTVIGVLLTGIGVLHACLRSEADCLPDLLSLTRRWAALQGRVFVWLRTFHASGCCRP